MKNNSAGDLEGTWVVISITRAGRPAPSDPKVAAELTLRDGEASGTGGVNRFRTTYETGLEGEIAFGLVASTRMAGPDLAMAQEVEFFASLEAVQRFDLGDGRLVLSGLRDGTRVVLTRR